MMTKPTVWVHNNQTYDCVYSPDDGGYYVQRHEDDATSQIFRVAGVAWIALERGAIEWEV